MARTLDLAKRTAILQAARTIFVRDGYAASKMSDIAAEVGVAQGTLYLYYESKELLASAIGEEFLERLISQLVSLIQKIEDPDGIGDLVDWAIQVADRDRVMLAMVRERSHALKSNKEGRERKVNQLAEPLAKLMSHGVIREYSDPAILADLILSLMRRVLMSYGIYHDENTDALKAGTITMLQHALFDDVTLAASRLLKRKQQQLPDT